MERAKAELAEAKAEAKAEVERAKAEAKAEVKAEIEKTKAENIRLKKELDRLKKE